MTLELLPVMINTSAITGDCRIVIVTSKGNYAGKFDPNNLNGELSYGRIFNYQNSKLYIVSYGNCIMTESLIILLFIFVSDYEWVCLTKEIKQCWSDCIFS